MLGLGARLRFNAGMLHSRTNQPHAVTTVADKRQLTHMQIFHARFRLLELYWYHDGEADLLPLQSSLYFRFFE